MNMQHTAELHHTCKVVRAKSIVHDALTYDVYDMMQSAGSGPCADRLSTSARISAHPVGLLQMQLDEFLARYEYAAALLLLLTCRSPGDAWKQCYERTAAAVARHCPRHWDFDVSSLYSYMDAFLQRCRDLLEVCEAQLQFATNTKLPAFGGTRGVEIEKNIGDIQVAFQGLLGQLKGLKYDILDIKAIQ